MLHSIYGERPATQTAQMINRRYGTTFTAEAVKVRANREGLSTTSNRGELTLSDAARQVGVSIHAVRAFFIRERIHLGGSGRCRFVSDEAMVALNTHFRRPPEPVISLMEAARLARVDDSTVRKHARSGRIRSYKILGNLYVSSLDVSRYMMQRARAA